MVRVHEQFDADRVSSDVSMNYRSNAYKFEIPCSVCGRPLYVGESTAREVERAMKFGSDHTISCSECERDVEWVEER